MNGQTREADRSLSALAEGLRAQVQPLSEDEHRHDGLLSLVGEARFVLLGEASHGCREFYHERAAITRRLIVEKGFTAVALEADWPDAWRINQYVRGLSDDKDANAALSGFKRYPAWMWRNTVMRDFVAWLREHNRKLASGRQVGVYGLDLYSLFASMQAVLAYLTAVDPAAARRAKFRYACFDHAAEDAQAYGYAASFGLKGSCEDEVVQVLGDMARRSAQLDSGPAADRDAAFQALQNARLVRNAEEYYRTMFQARVSSWNLRDSHMMQTLLALDQHLASVGKVPRMALWAHNSHLGNAAATEMGARGEWNVGQLVRERYAEQAVLVGFSTHHGTVTATSDWDLPAQSNAVRDGLAGSWEDLFHRTGVPAFLLSWRDDPVVRSLVAAPRLQRAIGVVYRPDTERQSHYFKTQLDRQFDAMVHIDETSALEPLDAGMAWVNRETPETFPSGM